MLASFRPTTIPDSPVPCPRFSPREGVPFIEKDRTHWYVKVLLPDVSRDEFCAAIQGNQLLLNWRDNKQINYDGRVFESRERFERTIKLLDGISKDDIDIHWSDDTVVVSIPKPEHHQ